MVLPSFAPGFGPFPDRKGTWINKPTTEVAQHAAVCLYAALVTHEMFSLIGASGRILIEGRFVGAEVFTRALATLRPKETIYVANAHNDVSFGALRLIIPALKPTGALVTVRPLSVDLTSYARKWREMTGERGESD